MREGQLYSKGLLGTGKLDSPCWAASTAAKISPTAAGSATETAPS